METKSELDLGGLQCPCASEGDVLWQPETTQIGPIT